MRTPALRCTASVALHIQAPGKTPVLQLGCELFLCAAAEHHFTRNSHKHLPTTNEEDHHCKSWRESENQHHAHRSGTCDIDVSLPVLKTILVRSSLGTFQGLYTWMCRHHAAHDHFQVQHRLTMLQPTLCTPFHRSDNTYLRLQLRISTPVARLVIIYQWRTKKPRRY